jgi:hypothetical protein
MKLENGEKFGDQFEGHRTMLSREKSRAFHLFDFEFNLFGMAFISRDTSIAFS